MNFLINALLDKIKPLVTVVSENFAKKWCVSDWVLDEGNQKCSGPDLKIQWWSIWKHIPLFRRICYKGQNKRLIVWIVFGKRKFFDWDLGWKNYTFSYWEIWVGLPKLIKIVKHVLNFLIFAIMMEVSEFLVIILYICQPLHPDLGGRNEAYSCCELGFHISIKIIINTTFYEFTTIRILMQGTISILLQWNSSPRVRPRLKVQVCMFAKSKFENRGYSILIGFFWLITKSLSQNDMMQQKQFRKKKICNLCFWIK